MENRENMSVGQWMLTLLIICIPIVNIIMLFIWAFSSEDEPKRNFAKAYLIFILIGFVLSFLFGGAMIAFFTAAATSMA